MVLLYLKDAGSCRSTISGMPDAATADLRAFPSSFPVECHTYRIYSMALYFPGRSEIIDMDGCIENILPGSLCGTMYLLYSLPTCTSTLAGLVTTISDSDFSKTFFF